MQNIIIAKIVEMFKKPLIGWIAAASIAAAAGLSGLKPQEVKDIACSQPVLEKPVVVVPVVPVASPVK